MGSSSAQHELPHFLARLRATPRGQARADLISSSEPLGKWAVPTLLGLFADADSGELSSLWNVLTRMLLGGHTANERWRRGQLDSHDLAIGSNAIGVREVLAIFRVTQGASAQGATRCRAKCAEWLMSEPRERARAEPIFRELDVPSWLTVRWDEALEKNDHTALWDQVPVWLCGSPPRGAAMLADALMRAPADDRWYRLLMAIDFCINDVQRAVRLRPDFFAWLETKTLAQIAEATRYARVPALVASLGGSEALAPHALELLRHGSDTGWVECLGNHGAYTPSIREACLEEIVRVLSSDAEFPPNVYPAIDALHEHARAQTLEWIDAQVTRLAAEDTERRTALHEFRTRLL